MIKELIKIICDKLCICQEDLTDTEISIINILGDIIISKGEKFDSFQAGIASQN
jgi:hypothetical protein